jgi:hypothetical protein
MKLTFEKYLIIISTLFFIFRVNSLGFDQTNNDSVRWFNRSEGFLSALKSRNFAQTYQSYHPGVTLMIVNSTFRQSFYTYQYSFSDQKIDLMSYRVFPYLNLFSKLGNILVLFGVTLLQVFLIKKLWRVKTALVYFLLISLEPYVIGINRWFHLTSFEVAFGFTSILLVLYFNKFSKIKYLVLSAFFFALAVLTKVTSLILGPIFIFVLAYRYMKNKDVKEVLYYGLSLFLFIFILFPALWVSPLEVIQKIFGSIFHAVGDDPRKYQLSYYLNLFYYFIILPFKLSPVTLILFMVTVLNFKKLKTFEDLVIYLTIGIYFILLSLSDQKIDRYCLVFFSPILLLSSHFISKLENKLIYLYSISSILFMIYVAIFYSPNYSAYYNPLLFGTKGALDAGVYENEGAYFYNAAEYLNNKNPKPSVFVPDNFEAFSMFYGGRSVRSLSNNPEFVVTSLDIDRVQFDNHGCNNLIKEFGPVDYKVVAIYSCK